MAEGEYKKAIHTFLSGLSPEKGYDDTKNLDTNRIHSYSTAYRTFKGAVVPTNYKKCSEFVLQGSNNTKITLSNQGETNTGEIKITAGFKRGMEPPKIKNIRPPELIDMEYEEYDKFFEGSPLLSKSLLGDSMGTSYKVPTLAELEHGPSRNYDNLTEPANICIREYQKSFSSIKNTEYYDRSGSGENKLENDYTGNIFLKTISNPDSILEHNNSIIDMLGPEIKISNSHACLLHMKDDGNIVLLAKSNNASDTGPYVYLGGENKNETEPVVLGDKLFDLLDTLIKELASGTVVTPAGTSSPISTLIPSLVTDIPAKLQQIRSKTSRVK